VSTIPALLRALADECERLLSPAQPPVPDPAPPAPAPQPVPPPANPPSPAPTPVPPPSSDEAPVIQPVNLSRTVLIGMWSDGGRYERFRHLEVLRGPMAEVKLRGMDFVAGGQMVPLLADEYTLLLDGVEVARTQPPAPFRFPLEGIADGWHRLDVLGLADGETAPSWWVYVLQSTAPADPAFTPVVKGTYEVVSDGRAAYVLAPGAYAPTPRPLPKRLGVPFDSPRNQRGLNCRQIVPVRVGDTHRPCVSPDGVVSAFDQQSYFWHSMVGKFPGVPLLDGPRGVGTVTMLTHVEVGQATTADGALMGNLYFCDPWRFGKVSATGEITTLAGYRHKGLPGQWSTVRDLASANLELVGDWSSVPEDRRGFRELWGAAWDQRTLVLDESAAPIPSEGDRKPHLVGPTLFLADTQNNRVCRLTFSPTSHGPAKVDEFLTGLGDPWDVVCENGVLYVSERSDHRIVAYDATSGRMLRVLCEGQPLAHVDINRFVKRHAPDDLIQQQACVAPEGLYKLPGDQWLYFGSVAMKQVRRVHVETGEVQVMLTRTTDGNSAFYKIAVSDGTFGPRGTIFVWSWSNAQYGFPFTWLPEDGPRFERWSGPSQHWSWYEQDGGAGQWAQFVYATAGAVRNGLLVCGGAGEGLMVISAKDAADQAPTDAVKRGAKEYRDRCLHLLHGHNGFGFYGLALPWGESEDIDAFLRHHGHVRL